jgi:hypothetical protein
VFFHVSGVFTGMTTRKAPSLKSSWRRTFLHLKYQECEKQKSYVSLDIKCSNVQSSPKKCKVVPLRSTEAHLGDSRCSSYSFLISALEGGEWAALRPSRALHLGKEPPVLIVQEAGWAPEPVWTQRIEEKYSGPVGDRTSAVQSIVRHYTDWAIPAPTVALHIIIPRCDFFSVWTETCFAIRTISDVSCTWGHLTLRTKKAKQFCLTSNIRRECSHRAGLHYRTTLHCCILY